MTDKKTETSQDDRSRSQSPVLTTPASKRVPPPGAPEAGRQAGAGGGVRLAVSAALVLALVAAGLSGALWLQSRQAQESQAQLAARVTSGESAVSQTGIQARQALDRLGVQEERLGTMQAQLDEAAAIIRDLDEALRNMTDRGSELVLLNDVDHLATIAQQQLELGGNVRNAIVALESAQAQLARANRPALASLLQTVNGDLDRLRAASTIDVAAFSRQLEELAVLLTEAPLIMPDEAGRQAGRPEDSAGREQPAPTIPPAAAAEGAWWERAWETTRDWSRDALGSLREDLGQFIDVRRVDDADALLMSPDQSVRFRENLRTRIMTAQLALMMRQPEIWKTETGSIVRAIETRYDESSPLTRKALRMARSMADASIDARLPTVDNTLQALNTLREEQARRFHGGEPVAGTNADRAEEGEGAAEQSDAVPAENGSSAIPEDGSKSGTADDAGAADSEGRVVDGSDTPQDDEQDAGTQTDGARADEQPDDAGGASPSEPAEADEPPVANDANDAGDGRAEG